MTGTYLKDKNNNKLSQDDFSSLISRIYLNNKDIDIWSRNRKNKYVHRDHGRILPVLWDN